ncbi:MAG TPA: hypothetical protein VEQ61_04810 [Thermoleophilaceae bacterium]|nr:hypothetical protein [Thermoleophilaceae bacterium]
MGGVAQAAKPSRTLATPKNVCSILIQYKAVDYTRLGKCMARIRWDIADYRLPSDTDPTVLTSLRERCILFEEGETDPVTGEFFQITYPFTFEEGPEWPFPVLTANNRRQCMAAIYTYHTLASTLGPPPAAS